MKNIGLNLINYLFYQELNLMILQLITLTKEKGEIDITISPNFWLEKCVGC